MSTPSLATSGSLLQLENMELRTLFDGVGAYFFIKNLQGQYLFANQAVCTLFRRPLADLLGRDDTCFFDLQRSPNQTLNDARVLKQAEEIHEREEVYLVGEDTPRVFWVVKVPICDAAGSVTGMCGIATDITHRQRQTQDDIDHSEMLNAVLSNVDAYIYLKDHAGRYLYANAKVLTLYGRGPDDVIGHTDLELLPTDEATRLAGMDQAVLHSGERASAEEIIVDTEGAARHFWSVKMPLKLPGQPPALIGFSSDITELLQLKRGMEQHRTTDTLTGLPNRAQFERLLASRIEAMPHQPLAVLLFDLDQFKYLNNSVGHAAGDEVLKEVAARIDDCSWLPGPTARLAGNEFALAVTGFSDSEGLRRIAMQVQHLLEQPVRLGPQLFQLTAGMGISVYPADALSADQLVARAEAAMFDAKEKGRGRFRFYSAELGAAVAARLSLERDLRAAQDKQEFELYYQPKIDARSGKVAGAEALLRWHRGGQEMVPPVLFIPLAEQLELIVQIGDWVIATACRQLQTWHGAGLTGMKLAVNLSVVQLNDAGLAARVAEQMRRYGIGPDQLELEITESMMMSDPEQAIANLQALRALGVSLSIDDFGTGYSSMAYLKRLPVSALKLDRSFIQNIDQDAADADLCAGVIALAHMLGLQVVAEGVETAPQRDALLARDCDFFQGYLFARPMPVAEATAYLQQAA
ncbi:putative bifunctional diguanylate cyclase/phosphodiesterase [Silvimonas iriomotensis]|uniref:PAS domain S-box-containing protein/diguanylate cyclase (GGDEF) domain-containing protein n=1 Tax=Silvimonas iriomotensis TaxID=449662 RepID=A0ABQ2P411_9NEIS|nr:EAL domain-containing protein [Silvimonas iriomotensis]GGP17696.1 hypothetical protein GCM10010970_01020 [Silvimonas iriomotensis]